MPHQTGPRTVAGKARSASNAVTHGFTAQRLVVPEELRQQFQAFEQALHGELNPKGALEGLAFHRLLHAGWNLQRLAEMETQALAASPDPFEDEKTAVKLERLARYRSRHERAYSSAMKEMRRLQTNRVIRPTLPAIVAEKIPAAASVQEVHLAKRNQAAAWPPPPDPIHERLQREIKETDRILREAKMAVG